MSRERHRIDRESAERMLDAAAARPEADPAHPDLLADPVMRVLAAASAVPVADGELPGEEAAVAAFRDHARTHAGAAGATSPMPAARASRTVPAWTLPLARRFSVKVAVMAAAVTAAGGIALASATGTLPLDPIPGDRDPSAAATGAVPSVTGTGSGGVKPSGGSGTSGPSGAPAIPPAETVVRLCQDFRADPGKARRDPAYAGLATAAGGDAKVNAYCVKVLATATAAPQAPKETGPKNPKTTPPGNSNGKGAGQGTGKPTSKPKDSKPTHPENPGNGNGNGNGKKE